MKKFDISAYADYTTSWGDPCYVGVLSIKESEMGKWVMTDAVDVFVDGQVTEARRLLTLEHIRETSEMRAKLHEMNMSGAADAEDYAKSEHYYATEIEKLKLQLETMTNDRDAEKSMKATARMQRDEQSQRIIGLKERLNHAYKLLGHNP
jgi:aspartate ammonia-lyase